DPPELSQSNIKIPPSLERIVRRCLEKDPDHRFRSASDLDFALESLSSISVSSSLTDSSGVSVPARRRFFWKGVLSAGALILLLSLFLWDIRGIRKDLLKQTDQRTVKSIAVLP